MEHVLWIGGGTGAGKTSVARAIALRRGLRAYHVDAFTYAHAARLRERELTPDRRWLEQSATAHAEGFVASARRRFGLVLDDLEGLPPSPPVVVEGPQVLPGLLPAGAAAVFLLPTAEFQRRMLERRGGFSATSDPARALAHRIERDLMLAVWMRRDARAAGYPVVDVDGRRSILEVADEVEHGLGTRLRSSVGADLAEVRRWENESIAGNIRAWLASPEAPREPPGPYPYACECGHPGCAERVGLTIDEFDAVGRVVAPEHGS